MHVRGGLLALLLLALAGSAQEAEKFKPTETESKLIDLLNVERKKKDMAPFKLDPLLTKVARAHSANMARQEKLEHNLDGKTSFDRIRASGYKYASAAENIGFAEGEFTLEDLVKGWMDSGLHRENILHPPYVATGLGVGKNAKGEHYFTQVFAKPKTE